MEKKVELASANSELSGSFGDDIQAVVDGGDYGPARFWGAEFPTVPPGLTVTESADIGGNLNYQSTRKAIINPESTIAGVLIFAALSWKSDLLHQGTQTELFLAAD